MESSMKEADYMMEAKDELKLTKQHMDELEKEGHCMCDGNCLVYWEGVKDDDSKLKELMGMLAKEKTTCVMITKDQMDMLHKDGKCECDDNVSLSYDDEMKEGDYMNDMGDDMKSEGDYMKEGQACNECGGTMVEGVCEGCSGMSEADVDENFVLAADEAKDKGDKEFEYPKGSGEMHPVTIKADIKNEEKEVTEITVGEKKYKVVEESINRLTEALSKNVNKKVIKEEMDFFNKMIKY